MIGQISYAPIKREGQSDDIFDSVGYGNKTCPH